MCCVLFIPECGGVVRKRQGHLVLESYPNNARCEWTLQVDRPFTVEFRFPDLPLSLLFHCVFLPDRNNNLRKLPLKSTTLGYSFKSPRAKPNLDKNSRKGDPSLQGRSRVQWVRCGHTRVIRQRQGRRDAASHRFCAAVRRTLRYPSVRVIRDSAR